MKGIGCRGVWEVGSVSAQVYPRGAGLPKCNAVVAVNGFGFFTLLRFVQNNRGGMDSRVEHGNPGGAIRGERGIRVGGRAPRLSSTNGIVLP